MQLCIVFRVQNKMQYMFRSALMLDHYVAQQHNGSYSILYICTVCTFRLFRVRQLIYSFFTINTRRLLQCLPNADHCSFRNCSNLFRLSSSEQQNWYVILIQQNRLKFIWRGPGPFWGFRSKRWRFESEKMILCYDLLVFDCWFHCSFYWTLVLLFYFIYL